MFNSLETKASLKHCGNGENAGNHQFCFFTTIFSNTFPRQKLNFSIISNFSSANAFNLDQNKILSFGEGITSCKTEQNFRKFSIIT